MNYRFLISYFLGLILGNLSIFIFSNFEYLGINLFYLFKSGNLINSFYEYFWLGFQFNIFDLFINKLDYTYFIDVFYPAMIGWLFTGLISGTIIKGTKRAMLNALIIVVSILIIWIILAMLSGANLTFLFFTNLYKTIGGILSLLIFLELGTIIGSLLVGKYIE